MEEMVEAFRLERVNPNPARFDIKKAEAINATHLRALSVDDLTKRMLPYLQAAGVLPAEVDAADRELLRRAAPLVHERMTTLAEAVDMLGFLFVDDASFTRDPADVEKLLNQDGRTVTKAAYDALVDVATWDTASIEEALRAALIDGLGLKPRNAFGPVRVAITGRRVSPPLFESMELLGRDRSLVRLEQVEA
jgi:glutamyl-tRNA synthetase